MRLCDGLHTAARSKNHHPRHRHANPPPLPPPHRPYWFNRHNRVAWALLAADTARALIARPQILYLDEATNQLDDDAACRLMQTLKTALPDTLCLAISHQAVIKALFTRQIDLNRYRAPAGLE